MFFPDYHFERSHSISISDLDSLGGECMSIRDFLDEWDHDDIADEGLVRI